MNLFDILSFDERIIVLSDEGEEVIYTWNQSLTLQCWQYKEIPDTNTYGQNLWTKIWEEIDVRTLSEEPRNFKEAREAAIAWMNYLDE